MRRVGLLLLATAGLLMTLGQPAACLLVIRRTPAATPRASTTDPPDASSGTTGPAPSGGT